MNPADTIIHTERLVLKDFDENNIEDIYEIFGDEETMRYYDIGPFTQIEEAHDFISHMKKRSRDGTGIRWGLFLDEKLIGTCGFNGYKAKRRSVIGYDLNRTYWNKGYVTEALKTICNYGFEELEIHRKEAYVIPGNPGSERVLEKCGFEREGTLKHVTFFKGQYHDQILYAKINQTQQCASHNESKRLS